MDPLPKHLAKSQIVLGRRVALQLANDRSGLELGRPWSESRDINGEDSVMISAAGKGERRRSVEYIGLPVRDGSSDFSREIEEWHWRSQVSDGQGRDDERRPRHL